MRHFSFNPTRPMLLAAMLTGIAPLIASCRAAPATKAAPTYTKPTYTNKREGYAIWLPGKPKMGSRAATFPDGTRTKANFISVSQAPLTFIVIPLRLPATPRGVEINEFLNGVARGFTRSGAIKLLSSKAITLNGYPGREALLQAGAKSMRVRYFLAGNRSYQVLAISPQSAKAKYNAQIGKVLNSFRILS